MLNRANIQWSGKTLCNQIKNGKVVFDIAIQRGLVWKPEQKSLLIHSMLEGYPIPAFYFAKNDEGIYEALDGKQRSNAIYSFVNGEYELKSIPMVEQDDEVHDFNGLSYSELPEWAQDAIKDYSLTIYYFDGITDDEVQEMFYRLNNGRPLTSVELTRVKAKCLPQIQDIASHPAISNSVSEKGKASYNDENIAIQLYAICKQDNPSFVTKDIRDFITNVVIITAETANEYENTYHDINDDVNDIKKALNMISSFISTLKDYEKQDKKILRKIKTRSHIVSIGYVAYSLLGIDCQDEFNRCVYEFFNDNKTSISPEYNASIGASSAKPENIAKRKSALDLLVAKIKEANS